VTSVAKVKKMCVKVVESKVLLRLTFYSLNCGVKDVSPYTLSAKTVISAPSGARMYRLDISN